MSNQKNDKSNPVEDYGIAALVTIARFHGISADAAQLKHHCVGHDGQITEKDLLRAARSLGLKARTVMLRAEALATTPLPALILGRDGRHFILAKSDGKTALLLGPGAATPIIKPLEDVSAFSDGRMILFASRASLAGELARFDFSWFIPAIVRYRKLLLEVLGVSLALQVFGLVTPLMFQVVMDKVLVNRTFSTLNVVCMALFICAIFEVLLTGLRNYVFAHTTNRIDVELGARLFRHLVALPLGYFGARRVGDKGVAPVTDALQAQTQYEQAVFALNKAYTDAQKALGTLASDMGFDPTLPVDVPLSSADAPTVRDIAESIDEMIASAKERHPSVRAAQAQYDAAVAKVTQTRAQGLPSISLVGKYSRNDQPQRLGLSMPTYPATGNDAFIGVQISIPLFEGFGRQYQIKQATAQAERQLVSLDGTRRQVALEVWTSYQTLNGATKNAETSASLLAIAERSWVAAQRRYDAGVGNIVELLNTQTALANAKQRRIQTSAEWDDARIDLATKLGRLEWVSVN